VTVVVPTRDRLPLLAQTLHSVLGQRDVNLEVVVVDEGSSDQTAAWLEAHPDPRLRFIRHDVPRGLGTARNVGAAAGRGDWLAFVDDDDVWAPDKLASQLATGPTDWTIGGAITFRTDDEGRAVLLDVVDRSISDLDVLPWWNPVPGGGSNAIVRRATFERLGGFDSTIDVVADWDLWVRLWQLGPPSIVHRPLVGYRIHEHNMSSGVPRVLSATQVLDHRYRHLRGGQPLDWAFAYAWLAEKAARGGARSAALRLSGRAWRHNHPDGPRLLARALLPAERREPVVDADLQTAGRRSSRRRRHVTWPPGTRTWLESALQVSL
jgi:glycosyltransferase involved in cell wall biosynthesis